MEMVRQLLTSLVVAALLSSCDWSAEHRYFSDAQSALKKEKYAEAAHLFEKTIKVLPESKEALESAKLGANLALIHLKDYPLVVTFLKHIVLYASDQKERESAQKQLAQVYFEQLSDYKSAVSELNRVLSFLTDPTEIADYRLMLARAYFFLNDYNQVRAEIYEARKGNIDQEYLFKTLILEANTYFNEKKLDDAIRINKRLLIEFPEKSKGEQVALNLAVSYEDMGNYDEAIKVLESMRMAGTSTEMIETKISRLKARKLQQPGAKGLKK